MRPDHLTYAQLAVSVLAGLAFARGCIFLAGWLTILRRDARHSRRRAGPPHRPGRVRAAPSSIRWSIAGPRSRRSWVWVSSFAMAAMLLVVALAAFASQMVSYVRARAEGLGVALATGRAQRPERYVILGFGAWISGLIAHLACPLLGRQTHVVLAVAVVRAGGGRHLDRGGAGTRRGRGRCAGGTPDERAGAASGGVPDGHARLRAAAGHVLAGRLPPRSWRSPRSCGALALRPSPRAFVRSRRTAIMPRRREEDVLRNALRLTLGLVVSLACLWFATRGTDWDEVWRVLSAAQLRWVLAALCASAGAIYFRAQRWRILLRPVATVPLGAGVLGHRDRLRRHFRAAPASRASSSGPALLARRVGFGVSAGAVERRARAALRHAVRHPLLPGALAGLPAAARTCGARRSSSARCAVLGFAVLLLAQRNRARAERLLERRAGLGSRGASDALLRPLATGFLDALGALESRAHRRPAWCCTRRCSGPRTPCRSSSRCSRSTSTRRSCPRALASIVIVAAFVFMPQAPGLPRHVAGRLRPGARPLRRPEGPWRSGFSLLTWVVQMLRQRRPGRVLPRARGPLAAPARARRPRRPPRRPAEGRREPRRAARPGRAVRRHRLLQGVRRGAPAGAGRRARPGGDDRRRAAVRHAAHLADALRPAGRHRHLQPDAGVGDRPHPARRRGGGRACSRRRRPTCIAKLAHGLADDLAHHRAAGDARAGARSRRR